MRKTEICLISVAFFVMNNQTCIRRKTVKLFYNFAVVLLTINIVLLGAVTSAFAQGNPDEFDDGTTHGTILDEGDQRLKVKQLRHQGQPIGFRISARNNGGATPATISICGQTLEDGTIIRDTIFFLSPGDQVDVQCGSARLSVGSGVVEAEFFVVGDAVGTADIVEGDAVIYTFDETTTTTSITSETGSTNIDFLVTGEVISTTDLTEGTKVGYRFDETTTTTSITSELGSITIDFIVTGEVIATTDLTQTDTVGYRFDETTTTTSITSERGSINIDFIVTGEVVVTARVLVGDGIIYNVDDFNFIADIDNQFVVIIDLDGRQYSLAAGEMIIDGSKVLPVVGQLDFAVAPGHISDVWAYGNYAYVGSFDRPFCSLDFTGIHIVDISDPTNPVKVGFIRSPPGTRANDVKVTHIETPNFTGEILVHSNEPCGLPFVPRLRSNGISQSSAGQGGVAIYDVTDPTSPQVLRINYLAFPVHNTFIYQHGGTAYMLVVDDDNPQDVHIVDLTRPWSPSEIAVTGKLDWPTDIDNIGSPSGGPPDLPGGLEVFLHDVWVQENGGQVIAYLSYWDAGLVLLDITDPANPVFLGDSEYLFTDPLSGEDPEGNSHAAVPTEDGSHVVMGDEDVSPFKVTFDFSSESFPAAEALFTKPVSSFPNGEFSGTVVWTEVDGCTLSDVPDAPSSGSIALLQAGTCLFLTQGQNAEAKGYAGFVVANNEEFLIKMAAPGGETVDIPGFFVGFSTGEVMKAGGDLFTTVTFDGWGYGHLLDVSDPANIVELGQFFTEHTLQNPPPPSGVYTAHNVMVRDNTAYWSWLNDGIRVFDFARCLDGGPCTPNQVGHFTPIEGSNFWGVYVHDHPDGNTYILASDRDRGLRILETPY